MDRKELTCIICPVGCRLKIDFNERDEIESLTGYRCQRGENYVRTEIVDPVRVLSTILRVSEGVVRMCPVKTSLPVSKTLLEEMAKAISKVTISAPIKIGDVLIENIMGTGANIISTRSIALKEF